MGAFVKANQSAQVKVNHQVHIPAPTAIPSIGPSEGHIFLAAEADAAIASISTTHIYLGLVVEQATLQRTR